MEDNTRFKISQYACAVLLTGNGWLHISWNPFLPPRHDIRIGYYK